MKETYFQDESESDIDIYSIVFISILIIIAIFAEVHWYHKIGNFGNDYFSLSMGVSFWYLFYVKAQRIVDKNLFRKISILGLAAFVICLIKEALTRYSYIMLFVAAIPFIYSIYFRILTGLFYKGYPSPIKKPVVIYTSQAGSASFKGKQDGYKPSIPDRFFSMLLFIGFLFFCMGLALLLIKYHDEKSPPKVMEVQIASSTERTCDCQKLLTKLDHNHYVEYLKGEKTFYTGKCETALENGNKLAYTYSKGRIVKQLETYPNGNLIEETCYAFDGRIVNHNRYFPNGQISFKRICSGTHTSETFYENGNIHEKNGYSLYAGRYSESDIFAKTLFDSVWKSNGRFDSVTHYSPASLMY